MLVRDLTKGVKCFLNSLKIVFPVKDTIRKVARRCGYEVRQIAEGSGPIRGTLGECYSDLNELANVAFQSLLLLLFEGQVRFRVILTCKDLWHAAFQFLLPLAYLCRG